MALFDFLKRKKEAEKASKPKKPQKKPVKTSVAAPAVKEAKPETVPVKSAAKRSDFYYEAVKQPHISEKATYLAEKNQYIFEISPNYNKKEIKKAVEGIYGVDVLSVNTIKIPAKRRRIGRTEGFRKGYVKAVVKIKQGQKIEIL